MVQYLHQKTFQSVHKDLSSTGVVAISTIKQVFPKYDEKMLMNIMTLLEFCHQVDKSEISMISGQPDEPDSVEEDKYFFPALLSTEHPEGYSKTLLENNYVLGWCLQCKRNILTSRFLHVLLLRLAFKYAALLDPSPPTEESPLHVERRECNIWKSGIHWQNTDGVETIIEVVEQNTAVIMLMGCLEGSQIKCIQLRSAVIECILSTKNQYSHAVEIEESFLLPSELRECSLKNVKDLYKFPLKKLSNAMVQRGIALINNIGGRQEMITINELLYFEPYTCLSEERIVKLIQKSETDEEVSDDYLRDCAKVAHPKTDFLKKILLLTEHDSEYNTAVMQVRDQFSDDPTHKCFHVFTTWKKFTRNPTYKGLRDALDNYSIFRGRNPLVSRKGSISNKCIIHVE